MITFDADSGLFRIDTERTSYICAVAGGYLAHVYYGRRLQSTGVDYLVHSLVTRKYPEDCPGEKGSFADEFPFEYPAAGLGDNRQCALAAHDDTGAIAIELKYDSHRIYNGKPVLEGLPASFGKPEETHTLDIVIADSKHGITVVLTYSVFGGSDAIAKSVTVTNTGSAKLFIDSCLSSSITVADGDRDVLRLPGSWSRERQLIRTPMQQGSIVTESVRGISSHQDHPFIALADSSGSSDNSVIAQNLVYSGSFIAKAQMDQFGRTRVAMGIHPDTFMWLLEPGESFTAPEVICVYSDSGTDRMTAIYHDFYRNHLIRSPWKDAARPVLVNSWEAFYFDYDADKLIELAEQAGELGIELLVVDDGWFGQRDMPDSSLGDWTPDKRKFPEGMEVFASKIRSIKVNCSDGPDTEAEYMKLGLWVEPEMVSPDSELLRQHPEWILANGDEKPVMIRDQYVLDFTRDDVVSEVFLRLKSAITAAGAAYLKWDMNRPLIEYGSAALPPERRGEAMHRYVLGLYSLQERILQAFPDILIENCCSGGGRFDSGMLYYSPQIWCSDNTDAVDRLAIQSGTALLYPLSCIGAHVSSSPNDSTGRCVPMATRAAVALAGTFGYELNLLKLTEEDKAAIPGQIAVRKRFEELIRNGSYRRLKSMYHNERDTSSGVSDSWLVVAPDCDSALLWYIKVTSKVNSETGLIRISGLDPDKSYKVETVIPDGASRDETVYGGDALINAGYPLPALRGDYSAILIYFRAV